MYNFIIFGIGIWGDIVAGPRYAQAYTYTGKHVIIIDDERYELPEGCHWEIQVAE